MKGIRMCNVGCVLLSLVSLSTYVEAVGLPVQASRTYVAGYTTNDEQVFGPSLERIANDTLNGIHIAWKDNVSSAMYNFFDRSTSSWRWPQGIAVFPRGAALGNLEISPSDGTIQIVGSFFGEGMYHVIVVQDTLVGSGSFAVTELDTDFYNSAGTIIGLD